jgi:sugar/nucleoside kinase (ribokinase family)
MNSRCRIHPGRLRSHFICRILVSGLINIETTLQVEGFPIDYEPVRFPFFGIQSSVSGVGYNVAKALTVLGNDVRFLSLIGGDMAGSLVLESLAVDGISAARVITALRQTPQSVILYNRTGRRVINTDLKDIQDVPYPVDRFDQAIAGCELAVLCNINFSRPFLAHARAQGIPIATDVHTLAELDDLYNRDFMDAASILFMSDERVPCTAEAWVRRIWDRYETEVVVVGLGAQGALLGVRRDNFLERLPTVRTRPVVSTIGAGDALFSAFLHHYAASGDPYAALQRAMVFASYKIGEASASQGFLDEAALEELCAATVAARSAGG